MEWWVLAHREGVVNAAKVFPWLIVGFVSLASSR
jgi:hypothetical protein